MSGSLGPAVKIAWVALLPLSSCSERRASVDCLLLADEVTCAPSDARDGEAEPPSELLDASDTSLAGEPSDAGEDADAGHRQDEDTAAEPDQALDAGSALGLEPFGGALQMDSGVGDASTQVALLDAGAADDGQTARPTGDGSVDGGADAGVPIPPCSASAAPAVGRLGLVSVVSGLNRLVFAAQARGSNDWYLVQQTGQVLVRAPGASANTVLLDLSAELALDTAGGDERGLLGLAFSPEYATSGLFYVMLTPPSSNRDQVRAYQRTSTGAVYRETLLTLPASADNHNGGNIVMRDGLLYVGTGDGGGACNNDKPNAPQLISAQADALFGKILRLDPTRRASGFAALGNPFPESPLVLHYGLRNPYRFGFDRITGDLFVADVGEAAAEEIDFVKAGAKGVNFGWAALEGSAMTCGRSLRAASSDRKPVFVADRRSSGCNGPYCDWSAVVGGTVYRGNRVPKLRGSYLAGDYLGERMVAFYQCDQTTSPVTIIRKRCDPNFPSEACFENSTLGLLLAIVEDNAGELYFVANGDSLLKVVALP